MVLLDDQTFFCAGACDAATPHERSAAMVAGAPQVTLRCRQCGAEAVRRGAHYAYRMRSTACGLELDGSRWVTQLAAQVECADCLTMILDALCEAPVPDWRPAAHIAEDYYAG